ANRVAQAIDEVFRGERSRIEKLFEKSVVTLGDHLDQGLMALLGGVSQVGRDGALGPLAVSLRLISKGLHGHQVDHALEIALLAYGNLDRHCGATEDLVEPGH